MAMFLEIFLIRLQRAKEGFSWSVNTILFLDSDLCSKQLQQPQPGLLEILENFSTSVGQMERGNLFPLTDGSTGQSALGAPDSDRSQS
jgi:hypothetical protein